MKPAYLRLAVALAGAALLSACEVGPDYQRPSVEVPQGYKEQNGWKPSEPQEAANGPWWSIYQDPTLDALERPQSVFALQKELSREGERKYTKLSVAEKMRLQFDAMVNDTKKNVRKVTGASQKVK